VSKPPMSAFAAGGAAGGRGEADAEADGALRDRAAGAERRLSLGARGSAASSSGGSWAGAPAAPVLVARSGGRSAGSLEPGGADTSGGPGPVESDGSAEVASSPANAVYDAASEGAGDLTMADSGAATAVAAARSASGGGRRLSGEHDEDPGWGMHRGPSGGRPPLGRPPTSPRRHAAAAADAHAGHVGAPATPPEPAGGPAPATGGVAAPAGADVAAVGVRVPPPPHASPLGAPTWLAPAPEPGSPTARGEAHHHPHHPAPHHYPAPRHASRGHGLQRVAIAEGVSLGARELAGLRADGRPDPAPAPSASGPGVGLGDWGPSASLDSSASWAVVGVDPPGAGGAAGGPGAFPAGAPRGLPTSPSLESLAPLAGGGAASGEAGGGGARRAQWVPAVPAPPQMTRSGRRRLVSPMQAGRPQARGCIVMLPWGRADPHASGPAGACSLGSCGCAAHPAHLAPSSCGQAPV